jgi:MraZ protein
VKSANLGEKQKIHFAKPIKATKGGLLELLFGEYYHSADAKGRVRIPTRFKVALGSNFMATKGTNGCLFLFSQGELQSSIYDKLSAVPVSDIDAQKPLRVIFSSACELGEDNQGRIMLPKNLREYAGITKDIVFIGVGNRAEIWAKENYDKYMANTNLDTAIADLKGYGV